ncbi:ABC transporter permease [Paludibacterium sp. B53371]|uniref:ABC transporter permease n=1 Tax=Paludibacterium sp. B53371 TaxID=2806263 RepID=UPI001C0537C2|nr:ABC transporter permease [Paludibacterium sp. B53371]
MAEPLLWLERVSRHFASPAGEVAVLDEVSLQIEAGDMVAIIGASGSGKSTLMNLLGCLDRPSRGCYRVAGRDTARLDSDALAALRRERFGFVFQRYHLLPHLDAADNVAMPAIYAGLGQTPRRQRALALLGRLGLSTHADKPGCLLSGGQQQRVSIARALMNGGEVILADEPTGALDSQSGREVMAILHQLHQAGHTIIIVTHDPSIAAQACRIIELSDGRVVRDQRGSGPAGAGAQATVSCPERPAPPARRAGHLADAFNMALFALRANRLRTCLTMLGIMIGIAAVVTVVALGQGASDAVLKDIRQIGTNAIYVYRGSDWADDRASSIDTLGPEDLSALSAASYVDSVSPLGGAKMRAQWRHADADVQVFGGGADVFRVMGRQVVEGRGISAEDIRQQNQVVVLDPNTRRKLFGDRREVLGEVVQLGPLPATVIGVTDRDRYNEGSSQLLVWTPYSTAASRLFGYAHFDMLIVRIRDGVPMALAEAQVTRQLTRLHGRKDFFTSNLDAIYQSMKRVNDTMSLQLSVVALIALLVGGIGVMNIMLVSVAERTREIGIRMAVGARQRDVLLQFLIEAVMVCLLGGMVGIGLALAFGLVFPLLSDSIQLRYSWPSVVVALGCSMLVGVGFGYFPARKAARLDPVVALARE